jgi:hypothetical protein
MRYMIQSEMREGFLVHGKVFTVLFIHQPQWPLKRDAPSVYRLTCAIS